jgi:hypothetical protein
MALPDIDVPLWIESAGRVDRELKAAVSAAARSCR